MNKLASSKNQPARNHNIDAIVAYFESGAKTETRKLGIELEHIIVTRDGQKSVSYSEDHGVEWVLQQLKGDYPEATYDQEGDLLGLAHGYEAITLEPAAQLELSAGPFPSLGAAKNCFERFEDRLAKVLTPVGKQALTLGYHPTTCAQDLELIPKRRYKFMNLYLGNLSEYGPFMMRGSASTQVSIDYTSSDDCVRKLRLAYALVPLLYLISDNTPYFEGSVRPHGLMRTEIWRYCDPDRCGLVPGVMDAEFNLRSYAEYVLDTPAILVPCTCNEWCYSEKTFGEIYADTPMSQSDVEHALSMLFNDVRLKTYIELRPGDAMPIPYALAYAAFIKGLFYAEENLALMDKLFCKVDAEAIEAAKTALMAQEYEAVVYGQPVAQLVDILMEAAHCGLRDEEKGFLEPLSTLTKQRTTLAQQALQDEAAKE